MADTVSFLDGTLQKKAIDTLPNTMGPYVRSNVVDCANRTLDAGDADVGQVLNIPANTWVMRVLLRTITAETANGTVDLGHDGNADVWGDALAIDAAAGIVATLDVPQYFATANTIDVTATTDTADVDIDGWKFEISAVMIPGSTSDVDGDSGSSTYGG
jgi:hypothetical protein